MVLPIKDAIIYGPVNSRRLGKSLGINLMPHRKKYCDFDCLYCHYGRTRYHKLKPSDDDVFPDAVAVLKKVEEALKSDIEFLYLTFSGNGEPTLHPDFKELVYQCKMLTKKFRPEVKVTLLSNSSTCFLKEIKDAIESIDLPIMKLDAGSEELFVRINNPVEGVAFNNIVKGLIDLNNVTIQTLFLSGEPDNSTFVAVDDWYAVLQKIKPSEVQIYTLDRPYAKMTDNGPVRINRVNDKRMEEIVNVGRTQYGLPIKRF